VEFELFAAYLIAAGAIERFLEIVSGWLPFRKEDEPRSAPAKTEFCLQRKADRGVMAVGLAAMVGTLASVRDQPLLHAGSRCRAAILDRHGGDRLSPERRDEDSA